MRAKVAVLLLVVAALAGACREKPRTLDVAEPGKKFLVRSGTTAGSDWPSFKFFVATPPKKGHLGNFDPLVYDGQGRELEPGN